MKECFKCRASKPLDEFYLHPEMADGRLGKCKDCTRRDVRSNRVVRIDYYRHYDRGRAMNPERVEQRVEYLVSEAGKSAKRRSIQNERLKFPHKTKARQALARAVRSGKLARKPCEKCGDANSQGHHADYSKPLDVNWLCARHHAQAHGRALSR